MFIVNHPGPWPQYLHRPENSGLNIMEVRDKYLREQLLFENQMMNQYIANQVHMGIGDNTQNSYVQLGYVQNYIQ